MKTKSLPKGIDQSVESKSRIDCKATKVMKYKKKNRKKKEQKKRAEKRKPETKTEKVKTEKKINCAGRKWVQDMPFYHSTLTL